MGVNRCTLCFSAVSYADGLAQPISIYRVIAQRAGVIVLEVPSASLHRLSSSRRISFICTTPHVFARECVLQSARVHSTECRVLPCLTVWGLWLEAKKGMEAGATWPASYGENARPLSRGRLDLIACAS